MPEGGLVPKSLYYCRDDEEREHTEEVPLGMDTVYHTAYVVKDYPHEVYLFLMIHFTMGCKSIPTTLKKYIFLAVS